MLKNVMEFLASQHGFESAGFFCSDLQFFLIETAAVSQLRRRGYKELLPNFKKSVLGPFSRFGFEQDAEDRAFMGTQDA